MIAYLKRILRHSANYSVGSILTRGVGILLLPLFTRFLSPSDYGVVATYGVLVSVISGFHLLGLTGAVSRFYYDYRDSYEILKSYIATIVIFLAIWGAILFGGLYIVLGKSLSHLAAIPLHPFVIFAVVTAVLQGFSSLKIALYRVREQSREVVFLRVTNFLLSSGLAVLLVVFLRQGAVGRVLASFITAVVFFVISFLLLRSDMRVSFQFRKLWSSLKFGLPLVPHLLAKQILAVSDRLFLNHFRTLAETGLYSVGYALGDGLSLILVGINSAWIPFFYDTAQKQGPKAKGIFSQLTSYYVAGIVLFALGISLFAKELLILLVPPDYSTAYRVVPIIALGYVFKGLYYMVVNQIFYQKKTYIIPLSTIASAGVNLGLNWLWIPAYGMIGAAWATVISFAISFFLTWVISYYVYPIHYELRALVPLFIACPLALVGYWGDKTLVLPLASSVGGKACLLILYLAILWLTFLRQKEKRKIQEWAKQLIGGLRWRS